MPVTALPQPMLQPKVPSMWAQPGSYQPDANKPHFETELEINDFPQHARWKVRFFHSCTRGLVFVIFRRHHSGSLCWTVLPSSSSFWAYLAVSCNLC